MDTLKVLLILFKKLGRNNPLIEYTIEYNSITVRMHTLDQIDKPPLVITSDADALAVIDNWLDTI